MGSSSQFPVCFAFTRSPCNSAMDTHAFAPQKSCFLGGHIAGFGRGASFRLFVSNSLSPSLGVWLAVCLSLCARLSIRLSTSGLFDLPEPTTRAYSRGTLSLLCSLQSHSYSLGHHQQSRSYGARAAHTEIMKPAAPRSEL